MSEFKRISFTTLGSTTSSMSNFSGGGSGTAGFLGSSNSSALATGSLRFGGDFLVGQNAERGSVNGAGADNKNSCNKTMRLTMELFPTDSCSYPEFNYSRLMHLEKKKQKKLKHKSNGFAAPFNESNNDDDVARIARELEKKYGSSYGSGRGRSKKDDHCDIGLGYDESDSFIDNTEAYDEIIPEEVETVEGGFYINCGALEFKKLHTESTTTKTDEIIKMPNRPRKRVISSSSSDGSSSSEEDADEDVDSDGEVSSAGTVKDSKNGNSITQPVEKRPRTNSSANSTTDKRPKSKLDCESKKRKLGKSIGIGSSSTSNSPKPSSVGSDSDKERVRQKIVKTTTIKDMLKTKRDNFLKMQEGSSASGTAGNVDAKPINGELKGVASKSSDEEESSSSGESEESSDDSDSNEMVPQEKKVKKSHDGNNEKLRSSDTKLPELEAEIMADIHHFKEIVKMKNMTGKRFQFDDPLIEVFLKIDEALLCVEKTHRNMAFAHLEYQLTLPKYFFLRKAKQLRIKEEKMKSKRALGKLRKAIIETMPGVIASFEAEIRKLAEIASNISTEHPPKMPKKKFPWNNSLRNLLYDVYQVRWTSFPVLGTRKETLEDFINVFLREKVVELWPKDWVRFEELQREIEKSKSAAKKAKEKKKEKDNGSNSNSAGSVAVCNVVGSGGNCTATQSVPSVNAFLKQFEEFATGSRSSYANSDTESVASSSTSNGLKRKNVDGNRAACTKGLGKVVKSQTQSNNYGINGSYDTNKKQLPNFVPASTNIEFATQNISTSNVAINPSQVPTTVLPTSSMTTSVSTSTSLPSQSKHSKSGEPNVQIIDLDNYRSPNDILLTSQQMLRPSNNNVAATTTAMFTLRTALNTSIAQNRRDSSSESDGVEFVGVYPAGIKPTLGASVKQKLKKSATSNYPIDVGHINVFPSAPTSVANINNNCNANNNNGQNTKGKQMDLLSCDANYDGLQITRSLKDPLDVQQLQQQKTTPSPPQNASKKDNCAQ